MDLFLARHGETISNTKTQLTGGDSDSPLTERGIEQAKVLGTNLQQYTFDAVYSSPLKRAIDTVSIAFGKNQKIIIDNRLVEIKLGAMDGMLFDDATAKYPQSGMLFWTDPISYIPPPNGEHIDDVIERVDSFLTDLIKLNYKSVFALTHGFVLRVIYSCLLDKSIESITNSPYYNNCELFHYKL